MKRIQKMLLSVKKSMKEWSEWQDAIAWAKINHPSWVELATQRKRPEIRETYRMKIMRAYYDRGW